MDMYRKDGFTLILYIGVLSLFFLSVSSEGDKPPKRTTAQALMAMRKKTDRRVRPNVDTDEPVTVNISMFVQSFRAVDEEHQEFTMDCFFRKYWDDPRLAYDNGPAYVVMKADEGRQFLWVPDVFFSNSRLTRLYETLAPDAGLKVFSDGRVILSSRFSLTFHCDMDLSGFPFDEHKCDLKFESYMHSNHEVFLTWNKGSESITIQNNVKPPAFKLIEVTSGSKVESLMTGTYAQLYARFHIRRLCMHYVVTVYIPSILLVVLLYVLFWTPVSNLTARSIYASFLFLAVVVILGISQYAAPQVGYVKALDVWAMCSLLFAFLAVLHLVIQSLFHVGATKAMRNDQFELMKEDELCNKSDDGKTGDAPAVFVHPTLVRRLDLAMRIIFPAAYALFNAIYWGSYAK